MSWNAYSSKVLNWPQYFLLMGKQEMLVQVFGSLRPMWGTWMKFSGLLAPACSNPGIWGVNQWMKEQFDLILSVSCSLSLCSSAFRISKSFFYVSHFWTHTNFSSLSFSFSSLHIIIPLSIFFPSDWLWYKWLDLFLFHIYHFFIQSPSNYHTSIDWTGLFPDFFGEAPNDQR